MNPNLKELASVINECNKHIDRISSTYPELEKLIPLNEESFGKLTNEEVRVLDQFLFRFSMLQDAMSKRLFPALLHSLDQDLRTAPFMDIINKNHALDVNTSREEWKFLRKLRDEFSHVYSHKIHESPKTINGLFEKTQHVYDTFVKVKDYSLNKFEDLKVNTSLIQTPSFPS